jgi:signal transduction histidine kinase
VIAPYVVAVVYIGARLQARGSVLVSLLTSGLVAVAFSPVRERLQRAVELLLYRDCGDPHSALDRLARRFEDAVGTDELLAVAADEVAAALRVPYAAIEVNAPRGSVVLAAHGTPPGGPALRLSCTAEGREMGAVIIVPVEAGELTGAEQRLLDSLLRPIGAAIHRHQLTSELARSREALVAAREEERTRLHRDLHDGLGPALATLSMLAEAAGTAVATDSGRAMALLETLADRAESAVADLRTLVQGLRPPTLDALGLLGAVQAYAEICTNGSTPVIVEPEPLPPLSPAVEVAAYRIAVEAVTNVARHAGATRCHVRMRSDDEGLHLEVSDDGCGLGDAVPGVGLRSMHGRAADLGGRCDVTALPGGGTVVGAVLPGSASVKPPVGEVPP